MKTSENQKKGTGSRYYSDALEANQKHGNTFFVFVKRNSILLLVLTAILLVLIVIFWKNMENKTERDHIIHNANNQLDATNQEMLKLMTKPMVWCIRADMLRGNMEQVDMLILDMIKEKNFRFIHLIAPNGTVLLSTNKSLEGKLIGNNVDASLLLVRPEIVVVQIEHVLFATASIFGVDKQIATLIIAYRPIIPVFYDEKMSGN